MLPGEYGLSHHPLFFLEPSYWCGSPVSGGYARSLWSRVLGSLGLRARGALLDVGEPGVSTAAALVEPPPDPDKHPPRVVISDMVKQYGDGNVALKGLSMELYEGQVLSLLGHNGAGVGPTSLGRCTWRAAEC